MAHIEALLNNAKVVACIGARNISESESKICILIGYYLAKLSKQVNSGNAVGADYSFASGANNVDPSLVNLYVVDKKHNLSHIRPENHIFYEFEHPEWQELLKSKNLYYNNSNNYIKKLFNRNAPVVIYADLVIALPDTSKLNYGGTGHAMKIAEAFNKPIINISDIKELSILMTELNRMVKNLPE